METNKPKKQVKVYINKDKLDKILDGRSYSWLSNKLNENGANLTYSALLHLIQNRNEWKLLYGILLLELFEIEFDDLFYKKNIE